MYGSAACSLAPLLSDTHCALLYRYRKWQRLGDRDREFGLQGPARAISALACAGLHCGVSLLVVEERAKHSPAGAAAAAHAVLGAPQTDARDSIESLQVWLRVLLLAAYCICMPLFRC